MEITTLQPVIDLTTSQQILLHAILSMDDTVFTTSELQQMIPRTSGESVGGVLGSLSKVGYVERLSAGREKRWRVATVVINNRTQIVFDLLSVGVGRRDRSMPQPQAREEVTERQRSADLLEELIKS